MFHLPSFSCPNLKQLSPEESSGLIAPFTLNELKDAVWDCASDRAPGPDGFNFGFFKHFWDSFKDEKYRITVKFHSEGKITRGCGSSFLTLIPKCVDPTSFSDYRPISLIGCISKVISKTLANRLKKVVGSVVSECQFGFLSNRNILAGPLIINEMLSWVKKVRKQAFILKIDIEKAYDTINWDFIDSILDQMGFPMVWRKWVRGILASSRASVLINGSPTFEFECFRGVLQGDLLSPFIFIIAMEALSGFMKKAASIRSISGINLPNNGPVLTHLMYADDVVFTGEWGENNIRNIMRLMRCFYLISG
ncbi:putative RNA-directed DNA polymerase [Helianthus debilis subsp. tardiflorus]